MSVPVPVAIRSTSRLGRLPGPRNIPPVSSARGIATTTSGVQTPHSPSDLQSRASPRQPSTPSYKDGKTRQGRRSAPQVYQVNAYKVTPYKLVETYTRQLDTKRPMLIRNLPGFLDNQSWFHHKDSRDGSFKDVQGGAKLNLTPGFGLLKEIFESAATGRTQRNVNPTTGPAEPVGVFDDLVAECKIARASLEGDHPPLLRFREWLDRSNFRYYSLDQTIAEIQEKYRTSPQQWLPFRAPLAFIRAVHQYNQDQEATAETLSRLQGESSDVHSQAACITGLYGLVILRETMSDEFPFPRIIRDIGQSTYQTKSCSIRAGVRPLRSDMRRYKRSTVVVGQLAGYSVVTLIPPQVKLLDGLPLEFHKRVPKNWDNSTMRFPLGSPSFSLSGKTWTREFEDELTASGDILVTTLVPGDGLLVPDGWWYGVRSINNELQLHATVTWFLSRSDAAVEDQEEHDRMSHLKQFPPWVAL
ncbi:hypothetical protein NPX13_g3838 [Xylaria arbuscula]|uniref:JmjC domain-containing protein n=1 Tax=Xylaria arbuscula TaxID=114810 RepID=A0A9W8TMF9_9PEZI|nr:hypothetical protein NPX13_g3838 [Xylaria arbuscula]